MGLLKIHRKGQAKDIKIGEPEQPAVLPKGQLGISDAASFTIAKISQEKGTEDGYLRVAIRGGGCSGLSLHYEWALEMRPQDVLFQKDEALVIIDKKSLGILSGATLDVRDYLGSKEFVLLNNPVAKQCSCGKSFSI